MSVVVCSFFELRTVSKQCIGKWIKCSSNDEILDLSLLKASCGGKICYSKMEIYFENCRKHNNLCRLRRKC